MSALGTIVRSGVARRRVQTLVMTLTTLLAVTSSVLAAALLVASQGPFDHAFARQDGAHLTVLFDPAKATAAQVAATAQAPGVSVAGGPYPALSLAPRTGANRGDWPVGQQLPAMTIVGRGDGGGPVDRLELAQGRWPKGSGEIVLAADREPLGLGDAMTFPQLPGAPTLTVVGLARSIGASADGWVAPAQLAALTAPGTEPGQQMLYRLRSAATDADVTAGRSAIAATVPAGSLASVASYLSVKLVADRDASTYVPFVVTFGVLGLAMSVLIIGIVVSGAVGAATRRIGILKALGFSPAQVARGYVGQALIPAAVGSVLGVALGNLAAAGVMSEADRVYGAGSAGVPLWIDLAVPGGALAVVALTALLPALRAGRLRAVEALAVGRTRQAGRGPALQHLLGRLPLPRTVTLALAGPVGRPARAATTAVAVALGTIGVTLGLGLALSLGAIQDGLNRQSPGAVVLRPADQGPGLPPAPAASRAAEGGGAAAAAVDAKIAAQPGTRRHFAVGQTSVSVAGLAGPTPVVAYQGDSSWGSYQMISGSWFDGPGQAVVPSGFLHTTGARIGDTITLTNQGHRAPVKIVGEALDLREAGMVILTDGRSLAGLDAQLDPWSIEYDIDLAPGTDKAAYVEALGTALKPDGFAAQPGDSELSGTVVSMDAVAAMLTAMLLAVAGLGVLNTVVLDTRERVHDLGVLKALGMAPRQVVAMVLLSVAVVGLPAGAIGVPIGIAVHDAVLPAMARAAGSALPAADLAVYHLPVLVPLLLGGLVVAVLGALLPAGWAARARTASALRTE
ncbi:hypothetical protein GCM10009665_42550 [Kitasatospora nipponensis]|uniref:ABC3 transporter permease C-terminal domain-containing protein n=1 Tax=Kitasatospora nipponensis TaxID=258049 RepID=A0ABN1WDN3_9ACTN